MGKKRIFLLFSHGWIRPLRRNKKVAVTRNQTMMNSQTYAKKFRPLETLLTNWKLLLFSPSWCFGVENRQRRIGAWKAGGEEKYVRRDACEERTTAAAAVSKSKPSHYIIDCSATAKCKTYSPSSSKAKCMHYKVHTPTPAAAFVTYPHLSAYKRTWNRWWNIIASTLWLHLLFLSSFLALCQ